MAAATIRLLELPVLRCVSLRRDTRDWSDQGTAAGQATFKILEDTRIKLGCVATDIFGKSGRDMLDDSGAPP